MKTSAEHSANPISYHGKGHKERIEHEARLLSSQGPNASSLNHQLGKSHQGTDGHTLGLRHINCHHVFSSAEIKGHKILLNINVLLPCEPPTFKDFAGQMPARWVLVAQSMATEECSLQYSCKNMGVATPFRSVLWKGKCHFHFRKAAGFGWVFMTTTTTTTKSVQLCKNKEKGRAGPGCT